MCIKILVKFQKKYFYKVIDSNLMHSEHHDWMKQLTKICRFNLFLFYSIDEQERVQQKVFTNWINYHVPNCIKYNLIDELKDGTKLLSLLEALTGETLVIILFLFLFVFLLQNNVIRFDL